MSREDMGAEAMLHQRGTRSYRIRANLSGRALLVLLASGVSAERRYQLELRQLPTSDPNFRKEDRGSSWGVLALDWDCKHLYCASPVPNVRLMDDSNMLRETLPVPSPAFLTSLKLASGGFLRDV